MIFTKIYYRVIPLWGDKIDFSDGKIQSNGFYSKTLSDQWDKVEISAKTIDSFADLMAWTMFQIFHKHAIQLFQENIHVLNPKEISKEEIEEQYFNNLNQAGWEKELSTYERNIS
jgi:hypothetical protein